MEGVIGFTTMFAGNFAPKAWAFCNGQTINIASNTALFSILGTTYGGNGTTTFQLPNLGGRRVVGVGQGPGLSNYALGQSGGSESVTLTANQMPIHVHMMAITATPKGYGDAGTVESPDGGIFAISGTGYSGSNDSPMKAYAASVQMTNTGADSPYEIIPPYESLNYIICLQGVFPPRG